MNHVLEIYALFMLIGCFNTLLIPETARKTLEELSGEDDYANRHESVEKESRNGPPERSSIETAARPPLSLGQ